MFYSDFFSKQDSQFPVDLFSFDTRYPPDKFTFMFRNCAYVEGIFFFAFVTRRYGFTIIFAYDELMHFHRLLREVVYCLDCMKLKMQRSKASRPEYS